MKQYRCPKCHNGSRFTRDVVDMETVDGDGRVLRRETRVEEGQLKCMFCGYPAVEFEEPQRFRTALAPSRSTKMDAKSSHPPLRRRMGPRG